MERGWFGGLLSENFPRRGIRGVMSGRDLRDLVDVELQEMLDD